MNFVVRGAKKSDLGSLLDLSKQFSLLNLPSDKKTISEKIDRSVQSFAGKLPKEESEYLFVAEDIENKWIAGSSQIKTKQGTDENPTYSFKVLKKERFSRDLGIGFIHQILRMKICTNGPTEVGGLVVDRSYRRRPEKVGRLTSLSRFIYIGMNPDKFEKELHSEMAPPLTEEGRSEFWEALGRRFTGLPYQEADALSHQNKEFIESLFPEEDIYLCLLDAKARLVLGRVGDETRGALHMLESMGFKYKEEVDPFDGGPHLGALAKDVSIIKNGSYFKLAAASKNTQFSGSNLVGVCRDGGFVGGSSASLIDGNKIYVPDKTMQVLGLSAGEDIYCSAN